MSAAVFHSGQAISVSVITGFLGSGKTTLLNFLLAHPDMEETAVLINEFGEVGLDHLMVRELDPGVVLLKSGCICCTVRGELVDGLKELYMRRLARDIPPFTRVVIETTGLADPLPIITCIMRDPLFRHVYRLDTIVTTVDAAYGYRQLTDHDEALRQAAIADCILLTKTDLTDDAAIGNLRKRLQELNPGARLIPAHFGQVPPTELFGTRYFDPTSKSRDIQRWLNEEAYTGSSHQQEAYPDDDHAHHQHDRVDVNRHDSRISSFCITVDEPIAWSLFKEWYEELAEKNGDFLLRVKGIVNILGEPAPFLIHCVQSTQHEPTPLPVWPDEDRRSRIVFITRDLPRGTIEKNLRDHLSRVPEAGSARAHTPRPFARQVHRPASGRWLNEAELSRLFAALADQEDQSAADALRLMLVTGVSCNDAREARWEEFDLKRKVWLKHALSAPRSTAKPRPRRIPLGDAALMLLTVLREHSPGKGYLFSGTTQEVPATRLDSVWTAAARLSGIEDFPLDELRPALATGLFAGLSPELTRSLMGLRNRGAREIVSGKPHVPTHMASSVKE